MHQPSHAYIPGVNERHAENAFDHIKATVNRDTSIAALAESEAFQCGMYYLEEGFYWESHEVLEAVWLALPRQSDERRFVQGIIQLANASLKQKMNRPNAVRRLCVIARELLAIGERNTLMKVNHERLVQKIDALEALIKLT